jgi:hypothetical protein
MRTQTAVRVRLGLATAGVLGVTGVAALALASIAL